MEAFLHEACDWRPSVLVVLHAYLEVRRLWQFSRWSFSQMLTPGHVWCVYPVLFRPVAVWPCDVCSPVVPGSHMWEYLLCLLCLSWCLIVEQLQNTLRSLHFFSTLPNQYGILNTYYLCLLHYVPRHLIMPFIGARDKLQKWRWHHLLVCWLDSVGGTPACKGCVNRAAFFPLKKEARQHRKSGTTLP